METDSESGPANLDIKLVKIDVKMQIRTLYAKVTFLQETGGMTEEIERMMMELIALCNKDDTLLTTRPPAAAAVRVFPKFLLKAVTMQAQSEYAGPDWKHLLIMPGDIIVVYAYINELAAIGFNTRTNLGGLFPVDSVMKVEPQPHEKTEIFLATKSSGQHASSPSSLAYDTGQYVRVCRWEKVLSGAYGFNLSTLAMGRFNAKFDFKKIEWHGEA
ncbi:hypothetical protein GP486_003820 [Trichoglossum hirsutum]|uniref:Uncharacterized protein n=1 Tax=Trichoglossum hirsutum TaxID=265104 RepID=A0A9P8RQ46_9PEZI|nr:hypothetical protein GP486_003820 [Trichoglossum hirsutum]